MTTATPKDAASIVLLRNPSDPHIYWVRRSESLAYMGGFHAFPGGQRDKGDNEIRVENESDPSAAAMIACVVRELFEETGVLIADGASGISIEERRLLRKTLSEQKKHFHQILQEYSLSLDSRLFQHGGRWVTPPFAPRRFDTWFFLSWLSEQQEPEITGGELSEGEWIRADQALKLWQQGKVILAPPTLHMIHTLASGIVELTERLTAIPEANRGVVKRIEMKPGIILYPVKTPTIPPATHTNCYIVGGKELVVIDPASPYQEEQEALAEFIESLIHTGRQVREIILTHFHPDHIGGAKALAERLGVSVAAHPITKARLEGSIQIEREIEDNDLITLSGGEGEGVWQQGWQLRALHTPGHSRDHLAFFEMTTGSLICGDLMAGVGTIVIDPPEGNMQQYLDSLRRVGELAISVIFPSHGPPIGGAKDRIAFYIAHRLEREASIVEAIRQGGYSIAEIVKRVYTDVPEKMHHLAARSVAAHIEKLVKEGSIVDREGGFQLIS